MTTDFTSIPFTDPRWMTLNNPSRKPTISKDGLEMDVLTESGTDWWRTLTVDSSSGVVHGFEIPITEEGFEVSVELDIKYEFQVSLPFGHKMTFR